MTQNAPFQTVVDALLDNGTPFPPRYLHRFSDIAPADLTLLLKDWPRISTKRKHTLLEDLEELAETDTLTSFDDMARPLLKDADPQVRIRAIRLLWESEDAKLVPIFLKILNEDADIEARAAAANARVCLFTRASLKKFLQNYTNGLRRPCSKCLPPPKRHWCVDAHWNRWDIPVALKLYRSSKPLIRIKIPTGW